MDRVAVGIDLPRLPAAHAAQGRSRAEDRAHRRGVRNAAGAGGRRTRMLRAAAPWPRLGAGGRDGRAIGAGAQAPRVRGVAHACDAPHRRFRPRSRSFRSPAKSWRAAGSRERRSEASDRSDRAVAGANLQDLAAVADLRSQRAAPLAAFFAALTLPRLAVDRRGADDWSAPSRRSFPHRARR